MNDRERIHRRMGEDWDRRAREDAQYYVAFGRRRQSPEEFFSSAADVLRELRGEFRRFPPGADSGGMAALEIGCGPGRLMRPLSEIFGRIAGVDVSAEMVELAKRNLAGVGHAEVRVSNGSDLGGFADESFDFVYSYAVFQHIPAKEVVLTYLREACRTLKPGGILKAQVNSLPRLDETAPAPVAGWSLRSGVAGRQPAQLGAADTWSGVSFSGEEIAHFALESGLQLLAMDGFDTQYLWFTARKPDGAQERGGRHARIKGVSNTFTSDRLVPRTGRFASVSLWLDPALPVTADLNTLRLEIDGVSTAPNFVGWRQRDGTQQVNAFLPPGVRGGALPVRLLLNGEPVSNTAAMRVAAAPPPAPRLLSVTDGVNLLSDLAIESRVLKVQFEDAPQDDAGEVRAAFRARLGEWEITRIEMFRVDPLARRYEANLYLPDEIPPGPYNLHCSLGGRNFPHVGLHVAAVRGE